MVDDGITAEAQQIHAYIPMDDRKITRIRRLSLVKAFVGFLGALLPVLLGSLVSVLLPWLFHWPVWPGALLLFSMLLLADMVLSRRSITWLRRNVSMLLPGVAGYFYIIIC